MTTGQTISISAFKRGAYIVVEGEKSDGNFYIIEEGRVKLTKTMTVPSIANKDLGAGDFFEVETALTRKRRLFNAIAIEDTKIIIVPQSQFNTLIKKKPTLVQKIILQFSQRMRRLDYILSAISSEEHEQHDSSEAVMRALGNYYNGKEIFENSAFIYYHFLKEHPNARDRKDIQSRLEKNLLQLGGKEYVKNFEQDIMENSTAYYDAGQIIFAEGMIGDRMFFIQSGSVKICKISNNSEIVLAVLNKGELFGEMALLESKPRSAIAIASTACSLIVITNQNFPGLVQRDPNLITRITTVLANRIWFVYRQIANVILPAGQDRLVDALLLFMEKEGLDFSSKPQSVDLNISINDLIHFTGMDLRLAKETMQYFEKEKIINVLHDRIIINNPQYVINRSNHVRENYELILKRQDSSKRKQKSK